MTTEVDSRLLVRNRIIESSSRIARAILNLGISKSW